jgi:hypothetical protein
MDFQEDNIKYSYLDTYVTDCQKDNTNYSNLDACVMDCHEVTTNYSYLDSCALVTGKIILIIHNGQLCPGLPGS